MDPRMDPRMDQQQHGADSRSFKSGFTTAGGRREARTLEDLFHEHGVRIATIGKMTEMGFTVTTLVNMTEEEVDDMQTILEKEHVELLVGERFGIKSAVRAEKKRQEDHLERQRPKLLTKRTAERGPPSKRAKVAGDLPSKELLSHEALISAKENYFDQLLQPPDKLPVNDAELEKFLTSVPVKLPLLREATAFLVSDSRLVTVEKTEVTELLAVTVEAVVEKFMGYGHPSSEATSSWYVHLVTGEFLLFLNRSASSARELPECEGFLDSSHVRTSISTNQPLVHLCRPDFSLYVKSCLILRWENKLKQEDLHVAMKENTSKLEKWSPLYYGQVPYVIGGACGGKHFTWLRLYPTTTGTVQYEIISPTYDLSKARDVVKLLLSITRMHGLLQKLQEKLNGYRVLRLYGKLERAKNVTVEFFPEDVVKWVPISDERFKELESLYKAVHDSLYVIHQKSMTITRRGMAKIVLHPVGYREATPRDLKELKDATHDILHGLSNLHKAGFTHRDIRWPNIVKVLIAGEWKYVIIDLEEGGPDKKKWEGPLLLDWDEETLDGGKMYTVSSDVYQFGKLLLVWLNEHRGGSKEERDEVTDLGNKMVAKVTPAATMLKSICKKDCKRCSVFGKGLRHQHQDESEQNPDNFQAARR